MSIPAPSPVLGVTAAGSPVTEIYQRLDALLDNVVGLYTLYVGDYADAASVMFISGVVEPYFRLWATA